MLNIRVKRHADTAGLNSNHVAFPDKMAIIAERGRCEAHMPEESLVYKYAILHNIYIYAVEIIERNQKVWISRCNTVQPSG